MKHQLPLFAILILLTGPLDSQINLQYESLINGQGDFHDQFLDVAASPDGGYYLAGSTMIGSSDRDLLVVKISNTGNETWRWYYSGSGKGPDEAKKISVQSDGSVIVAGYVNSLAVGNDFFVCKLNTGGDSLWTMTYNDPTTNLYDEPNDLFVTALGEILVTGDSDRDPTFITNNDLLTIKVNAQGALMWSARYNGTANDNDRAFGICADNNNNVFVSGRTFNGGDDDFVTIKYNSTGVSQWTELYDNGGTDRAVGNGCDNQGNVYVAGRSDNGIDDDYRLICYNSQGQVQFNVFYDNAGDDRPADIAVLSDGTSYITGKSDANPTALIDFNAVTVKFSATGTNIWIKSVSGTSGNEDLATSIHVSTSGNIAIGGMKNTGNANNLSWNGFVRLYSPEGVELISQDMGTTNQQDAVEGVFATSTGGLIAAGFTSTTLNNREAVGLYYTGNAAPQIFTFTGTGENGDNIREIITGNNGKLYGCGYSVVADSSRDFWVGCWDAAGNLAWSYRESGSLFGSDEEANAIALDAGGNVYVSGYLKNAGTSSDMIVAKFSDTGTLLWQSILDGVNHESDRLYDLTIDNTGNVYVCGKSDVNTTWQVDDEITLTKLNSNGILQWTSIYNGAGNGLDRGQFVSVAPSGAIYVGGRLFGQNNDVIVIKYNSAGVLQWEHILALHNGDDILNDMQLDASENIILCGAAGSNNDPADYDGFVASINSSGTENWVNYEGVTGIGLEEIVSISIRSNNEIVAIGNKDTDNGLTDSFDVFCNVYSTNGTTTETMNYASAQSETADDSFLDANGNPGAIIHTYNGTLTDGDISAQIISFTTGTAQLVYNRDVSDTIDAYNVALVTGNTLYCGGSSWTTNGQRDILISAFDLQNWLGLETLANDVTIDVYPNPLTSDKCNWNSGNTEVEQLIVTDMAGRVIHAETLLNKRRGDIQMTTIPSGIYQIHFYSKHQIITSKIIIP